MNGEWRVFGERTVIRENSINKNGAMEFSLVWRVESEPDRVF